MVKSEKQRLRRKAKVKAMNVPWSYNVNAGTLFRLPSHHGSLVRPLGSLKAEAEV